MLFVKEEGQVAIEYKKRGSVVGQPSSHVANSARTNQGRQPTFVSLGCRVHAEGQPPATCTQLRFPNLGIIIIVDRLFRE